MSNNKRPVPVKPTVSCPVHDPRHKHHALWKQWVQSIVEGCPLIVFNMVGSKWISNDNPRWTESVSYKLEESKFIAKVECEIPKPLLTAPKHRTTVYMANPLDFSEENFAGFDVFDWDEDDTGHKDALNSRLLFKTGQDAITVAKAMIKMLQEAKPGVLNKITQLSNQK